jgi:preprotein translocase subunit SecE
MNKVKENMQGIRAFFDDVVSEMRKTTWPSRQELIESTGVVIVSVVLISVFVGICDKVLVTLLRLLIPSG